MEEMVYTILYRREILNQDNFHYVFYPCYVIKGLYDEENDVFLDEINKSRYSYTDSRAVYDESQYCIGEIYTENDLRAMFPEANSLEDLEKQFFENEEMLLTVGTFDLTNDYVKIKKCSYCDDINEDLIYDEYEDGNDFYSSLKDQIGYDFVMFTENDLKAINALTDINEIYDYIHKLQDNKNLYQKSYEDNTTNSEITKMLFLEEEGFEKIYDIESVNEIKELLKKKFPKDEEINKLIEENKISIDQDFDIEESEEVENSPEEDQEKSIESINEAIDDALNSLNKLIGLDNVKETFEEIFSTMLFKKRTAESLILDNDNKHMVFTGNPGTGKTTVAEIVAPLFYKLGYLKNNKVSFVAAQDLIGKYVGHTAPKTEEIIKKNSGGLIVLDEAYILAGESQQFGNEAITVMIKEMEKNNTMFIFAGYKKEMEDFIKMNSGIESRIGTFVQFDDYNEKELLSMFKQTINKANKSDDQKYKLTITDDALLEVSDIIHKACEKEDFGNGRFVKKLFSTISKEHAKNTRNFESEEELYTITSKDIPENIFDRIFFNKEGNGGYNKSNIGFNASLKKIKK